MLRKKPHTEGREGVGVTSLADEIEGLIKTKKLQVGDECLPCDVKGCFDLAAVRGLTATRGKASALCNCRGKEGRQSLPGDGVTPAIPSGDFVEVLKLAERILSSGCSYDSVLTQAGSLHEATHVPPRHSTGTLPEMVLSSAATAQRWQGMRSWSGGAGRRWWQQRKS